MAVLKELRDKAIVGNCLYSYLSKGDLNFDATKLVLPYILFDVLACEEVSSLLITSRYNDLLRACTEASVSTSFFIPSTGGSSGGTPTPGTGTGTNKDFIFLPEDNDGLIFPNFTPTVITNVIYQNRWVWEWDEEWTLLGRMLFNYEPYVSPLATMAIDVGGIPAGTTAGDLAGNDINLLFDMLLFPTIEPVITTNASVNLTISEPTGNIEVGTTLSNTLTATFNSGVITDGNNVDTHPLVGTAVDYTFTGTGITSTTQSENTLAISPKVVLGLNNWEVSTTHLEGLELYYDSNGDVSSILDGSRVAGTVVDLTSTPTINGYYKLFYNATAARPTDSASVRSLGGSLDTSNTYTLNTGSTHTKFVVVTPQDRVISEVVDVDALNVVITSEYAFITLVYVNDAGGSPRLYNMYEMNISIPYSSNHRHNIILTNA